MKKGSLILFIFIIFLQSCIDDCDTVCVTEPQPFSLEIVDKTTGENVFTNGSYSSSDIQIINTLDSNTTVAYTFISEDALNVIDLSSIGWKTEIVNLEVSLAGTPIFELYVESERKSGDCCTFTVFNEISISGAEYQMDSETGIYTILIE